MQAAGSDWREAILLDFAQWLFDLPAVPTESARRPERGRGLTDLYSEVAALRQEMALQNRAQRKSMAGLDAARTAVSNLGERLRGQTAALNGALARRGDGRKALSLVTSFLEIRDSLARTRAVAARLAGTGSPAELSDVDAAGLAQTLELILRKVDNALGENGVSPIEAVGNEFDPSTMSAAGTCEQPHLPNGTVVEELRGGFLLDGRILRSAEVIVNKCDSKEDSAGE